MIIPFRLGPVRASTDCLFVPWVVLVSDGTAGLAFCLVLGLS